MRTDDLIRVIAADTLPRRSPAATLAMALGLTAALVALAFVALIGPRPDLASVPVTLRLALKQAWPILLAATAFGAVLRLAEPGRRLGGWGPALALAPALLLGAVAAEIVHLPPPAWGPAMLGATRWQCLGLIGAMALPLLAATLWALGRGASTRPTLTGAVAGLLSGGTAAAIYAIHCTQDSPLFFAVWYGVAILAVSAAGALIGRFTLRW